MGWKVTETQSTPNPNAMKLLLDAPVSAAPMSFFNPSAAADDPLASRLFSVPGITSLLMLNDFVTVNKRPDVKWAAILPRVKEMLENFPPPGR